MTTKHPLTENQFESLIRPHFEQLRAAQANLLRNVRFLLGELGKTGTQCSLSEDGKALLITDADPGSRESGKAETNGHLDAHPPAGEPNRNAEHVRDSSSSPKDTST